MKRHTINTMTILALTAFAATGCDVALGDTDLPGGDLPTTPTPGEPTDDWPSTDDPNGLDDPAVTDAEPVYYAVFVEDRWNGRCATSSVGAHGADIDAIGLWDPSGNPDEPELVGWLEFVDMEFSGNECDEYGYTDVDEALGGPDASLTKNFFSLSGGWLIGEFESQVEILPHYEITVHEVDDAFCGGYSSCVGSEGYDVYLATDLDCVNTGPDFRDSCMMQLTGSGGAEGSITLPVPDFKR